MADPIRSDDEKKGRTSEDAQSSTGKSEAEKEKKLVYQKPRLKKCGQIDQISTYGIIDQID